jgi:glycosyltransferase involved in cell wall biosynthesis
LPQHLPSILYVVPPAEGGMAEHVLVLLRGLSTEQFRCCLAAPPGRLENGARLLGIPVRTLNLSTGANPLRLMQMALPLAAILRAEKPDIIHAHSWSAGLACVLALRLLRRRPRFVCTLHSFPSPSLFTQRAVGILAETADRIVCVSQAISGLLRGVQHEKVAVIPNGITFPAAYPTQAEARKQLDLPQDVPIVGTVARLAPQKGVAVLVEASARLPGIHFAVIGEGPLEEELRKQGDKLGLQERFHWLGKKGDAKRLLTAFDIAAIPSLSEGSSLVGMEAMAAGIPIVASRLPALEEVIVDGECGLLVPPDNAAALAEAIAKLLGDNDLITRYGEAGQQRAHEHFGSELMLNRTEAVYRELLAE